MEPLNDTYLYFHLIPQVLARTPSTILLNVSISVYHLRYRRANAVGGISIVVR